MCYQRVLDIISALILLSPFYGSIIYSLGLTMKFRIKRQHNGRDFYYILEQYRWFAWRRPSVLFDHYLRARSFGSCKEASDALDNLYLALTTSDVIIEKELKIED